MKTSIKFPAPSQLNPVSTETPLTPPGYHPRVAALTALGVLASVLAITGLAVSAWPMGIHWTPFGWDVLHIQPNWYELLLWDVAISGLVFGGFTIWWNIRMVERPIRQEDALLRQDYEKARAEITDMQGRLAKPVDVSGFQAHLALHRLTALHLTGQDTTKRKSGLDTGDHLKAMKIARAIGLIEGEGKGTKWTTSDPALVFERLLLVANVTPDRAWISTPTGQMSITLTGGE